MSKKELAEGLLRGVRGGVVRKGEEAAWRGGEDGGRMGWGTGGDAGGRGGV